MILRFAINFITVFFTSFLISLFVVYSTAFIGDFEVCRRFLGVLYAFLFFISFPVTAMLTGIEDMDILDRVKKTLEKYNNVTSPD